VTSMRGEPVIIHNRYTGASEEEAIFGEGALRWTYESISGRAVNWMFISRPFLSKLFGWYMRRPVTVNRIQPFIDKFGLDVSEFKRPLDEFQSFNDFFRRELKEDARPIDSDPASVVFPADGRHLAWENLGTENHIFVKGQQWNLKSLLGGDESLVERFTGGTLVLSRLCPTDYHHFHYPVGGISGEPKAFKGPLYSVNPISLRLRAKALWHNYRCLSLIRTTGSSLVCFLEIGATNVGSIHHCSLSQDSRVSKGEAKGWFEFGGSSVITIFESGQVTLCEDLLEQSGKGIELYARMGDKLGSIG